ncbi:hypothetical protein ACLQ3K_24540 [Tsukamurella sp. DT100]|uniref:hypothetical protein n=1 Tax=Tsukamurella sp. DT100 TaxID=3393415 RepID=UPI003CE89B57
MSEIQLMMSNDGRVLCAVHARREPEVVWERLATVVAADGDHACAKCGASVDEGLVYADFDEPDLWLARYDISRSLRPVHDVGDSVNCSDCPLS